jgi:predicted Zn-dependent peptidase
MCAKLFRKLILFMTLLTATASVAGAQGLKGFQLPNGLKVFVWEDDRATDVFGMVAVNVGAKEDPEEYTGLAHYLEHVMFKGTNRIGTLDWDAERPIYEQIVAKYDELAETADTARRRALALEINSLTQQQANHSISTEFSALVQSIGGEGLNAGTSWDYTYYYNSFPPGEINRWLDLYSERLINPVFRSFQPELETVYEEYNLYQDDQQSRENEFLLSALFDGHPYARSIIGLPEHLKNPRLSKLIDFYNRWYVPSNMALILAGKVNTQQIIPAIREKFGRIENRPAPDKKIYPEIPLKGRKEISAKMSEYPQVILAFPGITSSSNDDIALDICTGILSNSSRTGLLDRLVINGDLLAASADVLSLNDRGYILVTAVPNYDRNQMRFESLGAVEKMLLAELKKIKEGLFDEWLVASIKNQMLRHNELTLESTRNKGYMIAQTLLAGKDMSRLLNYNDLVATISDNDIKDVTKKYFGDNFIVIRMNEGKPPKGKEIEKPEFKPIRPAKDAESDYAKYFAAIPSKPEKNFADLNSVESRQINQRSQLFYTKNPENGIFSLVLKYGVGSRKMPKLQYAVQLMNNAGIMGLAEGQEVKQAFSDLGATCTYSLTDSYLYVEMEGFEENLQKSCNLLTRQTLFPKLDEKQMNSVLGSETLRRQIEKKNNDILSAAMQQFLLYGDRSAYIDRLTEKDLAEITISSLTGEFQRATDFEAEIYYTGTLPIDTVYEILRQNLPLKLDERPTSSPEVKERAKYAENTVLFLPNSDAKQSSIYFFVESDPFSKDDEPNLNAFNEYFSGGFTSLVLQEIREYRSMAYSAGGYVQTPPRPDANRYFAGALGTQADKTVDAIEVFVNLLRDMPEHPDRMAALKNYLKETATTEKPHFRTAGQIFRQWRRMGFDRSPGETFYPAYETMRFDDIVHFYNEKIKGRPIAIGIVGDPKKIDEKALEKFGKVVKISAGKVFSK